MGYGKDLWNFIWNSLRIPRIMECHGSGKCQVLDMNRLGEIKFLFEYPRFGGIRRDVKGQNAVRGEY